MMDLQFLQVRQALEHISRQLCDVVHAEVTTERKTDTRSVEEVQKVPGIYSEATRCCELDFGTRKKIRQTGKKKAGYSKTSV